MGWFGKPTPEQEQKARNKALLKAAKRGDTQAVEKLLAEGADIEIKGVFWKNTPLIAAAWHGHTETVKLLLDKGARIDATNSILYTPLNAAVLSGHTTTVDVLLQRGASLDITDTEGRTPYQNALKYKMEKTALVIARHIGRLESLKKEEDVRRAAEAVAKEKARAEKKTAEELATKRRVQKEHADVVIFTQQLGDLTLEDAFNFVSLERLTFVRKGPGGDVQSMTRQSFGEVDNKRLLRKAFEEHVRRGGTTPEVEVFPDGKPRIRPPGAQP